MLLHHVSFSVWHMGLQAMFSYLELDKDYNRLYSMTYPITAQEAMDICSWATYWCSLYDASPSFDPWGWTVYMSPNSVIQPDSCFRASHISQRNDPNLFDKYRELVWRPHTLEYHGVK